MAASGSSPPLSDSGRLTWVLGSLTLAAGLWGLWPHLAPRASTLPQTVRQALPLEPASTAETPGIPVQPTTASVRPLLSGPLNLNTATQEQLEALPGVGPVLARRLLGGRPYRSLADLDAVKGVGESAMKRLGPLVTF